QYSNDIQPPVHGAYVRTGSDRPYGRHTRRAPSSRAGSSWIRLQRSGFGGARLRRHLDVLGEPQDAHVVVAVLDPVAHPHRLRGGAEVADQTHEGEELQDVVGDVNLPP